MPIKDQISLIISTAFVIYAGFETTHFFQKLRFDSEVIRQVDAFLFLGTSAIACFLLLLHGKKIKSWVPPFFLIISFCILLAAKGRTFFLLSG